MKKILWRYMCIVLLALSAASCSGGGGGGSSPQVTTGSTNTDCVLGASKIGECTL